MPVSPMGIDGHSFRGGNSAARGVGDDAVDVVGLGVTTPPSRPYPVPSTNVKSSSKSKNDSTGSSEDRAMDGLPQNIIDIERLLKEQSSPTTASSTSATQTTMSSPGDISNNHNSNSGNTHEKIKINDAKNHTMIHQQELELKALRLMYDDAKTKMEKMKHEKETNKRMLLEMSQLVKGLQTIALRSKSSKAMKNVDDNSDASHDDDDSKISSSVVQSQIQEIDRRMKEAQKECGLLLEEKFEQSQKYVSRIKIMEQQILLLVDQLEEQTDVKASSESDLEAIITKQESQIQALVEQIAIMKQEQTEAVVDDGDGEENEIYEDNIEENSYTNSKSGSRVTMETKTTSVDDILDEQDDDSDDEDDDIDDEDDEDTAKDNAKEEPKDVPRLTQKNEELRQLMARNAQKYNEINQLQSKLDALREKQRAHQAQFGTGHTIGDSSKIQEIMHVEEEADGAVTVRVYKRESTPPALPSLRTSSSSTSSSSSSSSHDKKQDKQENQTTNSRRFSSSASRSSQSSRSSSGNHALTVISEEGESAFNSSRGDSFDRSPNSAAFDTTELLSSSLVASSASSSSSSSSSSASSTGWKSSSGSSNSRFTAEEDIVTVEKPKEVPNGDGIKLPSHKCHVEPADEKSNCEGSLEPSEAIEGDRSDHSTQSTAVSYVDDDNEDEQKKKDARETSAAEEIIPQADESLHDGDDDEKDGNQTLDETAVGEQPEELVRYEIDENHESKGVEISNEKDDKSDIIVQHSQGKAAMLRQELEVARSKFARLCANRRTDTSTKSTSDKFEQLELENRELRQNNMIALNTMAQVAELTARSENLKDENEQLRKELEELKAEKHVTRKQLEEIEQEKAQSAKELEDMTCRYAQIAKDYEKVAHRATIVESYERQEQIHNATVMKLADVLEDNSDLQKELETTKAQLQKAFGDLQRAEGAVAELEKIKSEYQDLLEVKETTDIQVQRLTEKYAQLRVLHEQSTNGNLPKDTQKLQSAYAQALSRLEHLERANEEAGDASAKLGASQLKLTMREDEMKMLTEKVKTIEKKLVERESQMKDLIAQYKILEKEKAKVVARLEKAEAAQANNLQSTSRVESNDTVIDELKATLLASRDRIVQLEKERDDVIEKLEAQQNLTDTAKRELIAALEAKNARENDIRIVMGHHKKLLEKYDEAQNRIAELEKAAERVKDMTNHTRTTAASMSIGPNTEPVMATLDYLYEEEKKEDTDENSPMSTTTQPKQRPTTLEEAYARVVQSKLKMEDDDDSTDIRCALSRETIEEVIVDEDGNEYIEEVISPPSYEEIEIVEDSNVNATLLLRQSEAKVASLTRELKTSRDQVETLQAEKKRIQGELSEVKSQLLLSKRRAALPTVSAKWNTGQKNDTSKGNEDEDSMGFSENSVGFAHTLTGKTGKRNVTNAEGGSSLLKPIDSTGVSRDDAFAAGPSDESKDAIVNHQRLQKLYDSLQARYNKLEQELAAAKKELKERTEETNAARLRANTIQSQHQALEEEHSSIQQRLAEAKSQLDQLKNKATRSTA